MTVELRIHGVSGTPASEMLGGDVEPDPRFAGTHGAATVLRPSGGDGTLLAYRWASRTSGTAARSLWLLLVPYMLHNVAGWALPPAPDRRHRWAVGLTRVAGLLLTLIFSLVTAIGVIDIGALQVMHLRWGIPWSVSLWAGVVVSALTMSALWFTSSRAEESENDRPYLRSTHVATALWGIWATVATTGGAVADQPHPVGSTWVLPAALSVMVAASSTWRGLEDVTRVAGMASVAATGLLTFAGLVRYAPAIPEVAVVSVGAPLRGTVLAYLVVGVATTALAWSADHPDAGPAVASLLALAGATGASVGAGAVVAAGAAFGVSATPSTGAFAEGFLVGTLAIVAVTAMHGWSHAEPADTPSERLLKTIVSVRDDVRPILIAIPGITVAVSALVLSGLDGVLPWAGLAAAVGVGASTAAAAWKLRLGRFVAVGPILMAVGAVAALVVGFRTVSVAFALILPFGLVVARIVRAWTDAERRRVLAIPWDVGSFFSRRFHPFSPPTYRDVVRRDLTSVIDRLSQNGAVIVSAHSQGSVVGTDTLYAMDHPGVSLLTYGSPIGTLYQRFFPVSFDPANIDRVHADEWINLWRPTDPIGGAIRSSIVDDRSIEDMHLRSHGGYWRDDEPDFAAALTELRA